MTARRFTPYVFEGRLNVGLVRLGHPRYGTQLWTTGKIRGHAKDCAGCHAKIDPATLAFRPLTNGYNRMERLCMKCVLAMEEAKRPMQAAEPTEGPCFHCAGPCTADHYCHGCRAFICPECEGEFPMGFDHSPEEHLAEEERTG